MQDIAMTHTANFAVTALWDVRIWWQIDNSQILAS